MDSRLRGNDSGMFFVCTLCRPAFLPRSERHQELPEGILGGLSVISETHLSAVVEPELEVELLKIVTSSSCRPFELIFRISSRISYN
jgi:hypothetical protein